MMSRHRSVSSTMHCKWLLVLLLLAMVDPFSTIVHGFLLTAPHHVIHRRATAMNSAADTAFLADPSIVSVRNATCTLVDKPLYPKRRRFRFWKRSPVSLATYQFDYNYNEVEFVTNKNNSNKITAILLIHPIGVGISKWFYYRLLQELHDEYKGDARVVVLVPDLLACGSASNPIVTTTTNDEQQVRKLPLFNVTDWSNQVQQLMVQYEETQSPTEVDWCIVSNGGCVPIALDIGQSYCSSQHPVPFKGNLTNIVLSAPPRLNGLLQYPPPSTKIEKSYRTLAGTAVGRLFWWYSLRNQGAFIRTFSENNLAASADNLGEEWTPTCVDVAKNYPLSRYSTFAFLAGALQQSCRPAFNAFSNSTVAVDVILGGDKRRNPARSWFWERKRGNEKEEKKQETPPPAATDQTLANYLQECRIHGGRETIVGGRRCPAHEDASGFASALISYLSSS